MTHPPLRCAGVILVFTLAAGSCAVDPPDARSTDGGDAGGADVQPVDTAGDDGRSDAGRRDGIEGDTSESRDVEPDGSDASDGGVDLGDAGGDDRRCRKEGETLSCRHQTATLLEDADGSEPRQVHWQVPTGAPPADGWPVAIVFQGAFTSSRYNWEGEPNDAYGRYHQVRMIRALFEAGIAVLMPEALGNGSTYWQSNIPPYATNWESSADHEMMLALFEAIDNGTFGDLNADRMFATGFSSGGYMTSRMAVAYTDRFAALAIHSGSYATCSSSACAVPDDLPDGHPPTLFLHGENDTTVPVWTMRDYRDELKERDISTRTVVDPSGGHAWIAKAPEAIPMWFRRF